MWLWVKIKELGQTAGFSLWFHLPRVPFWHMFLSHSHVGVCVCRCVCVCVRFEGTPTPSIHHII